MNLLWGQECVAIMQKSPKETYLIKKEKLLISKNLAIRERKAFDLKRKAFDFQENCQNKKEKLLI